MRVNQDPTFYDLGLCGPMLTPVACSRHHHCATSHAGTPFFTTASHSLQQVLSFYAEHDRHPEDIYPRDAHGRVEIYDDLPMRYRGNIDRVDVPFQAASAGLSAQQQSYIIAFLGTLSDADTSSH